MFTYSNRPEPCWGCGALPEWYKGEERWCWSYNHSMKCPVLQLEFKSATETATRLFENAKRLQETNRNQK